MKATIDQVSYDLNTLVHTLYLSVGNEQVRVNISHEDSRNIINVIDHEWEIDNDRGIVYYIARG
jgi:hypothetical protein